MKKKKIFGVKHVITAALLLALGGAVWLNMQYSAATGGFIKTSGTNKKNIIFSTDLIK